MKFWLSLFLSLLLSLSWVTVKEAAQPRIHSHQRLSLKSLLIKKVQSFSTLTNCYSHGRGKGINVVFLIIHYFVNRKKLHLKMNLTQKFWIQLKSLVSINFHNAIIQMLGE